MNAQSKAANASIAHRKGTDCAKILGKLKALKVKGATCEELETVLGMKHQTCSARLRDLFLEGAIARSGTLRPTESGRMAAVWKAVTGDAVVPPAPASEDPKWERDSKHWQSPDGRRWHLDPTQHLGCDGCALSSQREDLCHGADGPGHVNYDTKGACWGLAGNKGPNWQPWPTKAKGTK